MPTINPCSGCDLYLVRNTTGNIQLNNNPPTGGATGIPTSSIIGNGVGQYVNVRNIALGGFQVLYNTARDGACQSLTGEISGSGSNGFNWSYLGATGCTTASGCTYNLLFNLQNNFPPVSGLSGAVSVWTITDFYNNSSSTFNFNTATYQFSTGTTTKCGSEAWYAITNTIIPVGNNVSGYFVGTTGFNINCTTCVTS